MPAVPNSRPPQITATDRINEILESSRQSEEYAKKIYSALCEAGVRCEFDNRNEKIGYMIREAQLVDRVPYMLVVGDKEAEENTVSVRKRGHGDMGSMPVEEFINLISGEVDSKVIW